MENHEITYSQDDVDAAIVFAVEDAIGKRTPSDKIFKIVKENSLVEHVLSCKSVEEIAARYQEMVEMQRCLPLEDLYGEKTDAAHTVEDKTLEAEQPIVAKAGIASHKPPKQWSSDEDDALIALVKEYQYKDMTVTQVFEKGKSLMPLTHILYSRSEEALGTRYRKLVNDKKCPQLLGSIARKGGKNSGVVVSVPRKKRSGANTGSGANAGKNSGASGGKNSGAGPQIGEELAAALEVIFEYFAAKVAHKISDMFPKTKDAK
jgi:hypothetical protein